MSFSSNYTSTTSDKTVFVTWEAGFDNFKIYRNQSVVLKVEDGSDIRSGVSQDIEGLGKVELYLPNKAHSVHMTIDDESYTKIEPSGAKVDLAGVSYLFWTLTGFAILGSIITLSVLGLSLTHPFVIIQIILDVVAISAYVLAAIFTGKGKPWGYFLGGSVFILMTLLEILGAYTMDVGMGVFIRIMIRLAIIGYLIFEFKKVKILMNASNSEGHSSSELLDL